MRPLSPHLNYSTFNASSWVLYGKGEALVEFRDRDISLWEVVRDKWGVVTLSVIEIASGILIRKSGVIERIFVSENAAQDKLAVGIAHVLVILVIAWGALFLVIVLMRWCTPLTFVRISGGMMSIEQPFRWKRRLREFKVSDITSVQTSAGNPTFHTFFASHGVWLRDGTKITFLRCRTVPEAQWVLKLMEQAVAKELAGVTAATADPTDAAQPVS